MGPRQARPGSIYQNHPLCFKKTQHFLNIYRNWIKYDILRCIFFIFWHNALMCGHALIVTASLVPDSFKHPRAVGVFLYSNYHGNNNSHADSDLVYKSTSIQTISTNTSWRHDVQTQLHSLPQETIYWNCKRLKKVNHCFAFKIFVFT